MRFARSRSGPIRVAILVVQDRAGFLDSDVASFRNTRKIGHVEKEFRERSVSCSLRARACVPSLCRIASQSVGIVCTIALGVTALVSVTNPTLLVAKVPRAWAQPGVEVWKLGVCHFHTRPKSEALCVETGLT